MSDNTYLKSVYSYLRPFIDSFVSGGRSIDPELSHDFIYSFDDEFTRILVHLIIENTQYYTFDQLLEIFYGNLRDALTDMKKSGHSKVYMLLNKGKIGSEHLFIILAYKIIEEFSMDIKLFSNGSQITDSAPILIVDDAIYSGISLSGTLDELLYEVRHNNEIYVVSSFASPEGKNTVREVIDSYGRSVKFFSQDIFDISSIPSIMGGFVNKEEMIDYLYQVFGSENIPFAIYTDIKIANEFGSFPMIYNKVIKNLPSRELIERIPRHLVNRA